MTGTLTDMNSAQLARALLQREALMLPLDGARAALCNRRVLITGAAGSIGAAIAHRLNGSAAHLLLLDHASTSLRTLSKRLADAPNASANTVLCGDVANAGFAQQAMHAGNPDVVFHAAAQKHVSVAQQAPLASIASNVLGTANILAACPSEADFLLISTDKAADPAGVMGASKRAAELLIQQACANRAGRTRALRLANVLGSADSVLPRLCANIAKGRPLVLTDLRASRLYLTLSETVDYVLLAITLEVDSALLAASPAAPITLAQIRQRLLLALDLPGDYPQQIVGLGDGEKTHETLAGANEQLCPTPVPGLVTVQTEQAAVCDTLARLLVAARANATADALRLLGILCGNFSLNAERDSRGVARGVRG